MRLFRLLALGLATSALFACAQEREPIDRTQPNYYDKEYFDGEWYYQRTIVDVPAGEGPFIVGEAGWRDLYKITWDVQENWLYARRSYELLRGGDQAEQQGEDYEGEVVAAYPITRQDRKSVV